MTIALLFGFVSGRLLAYIIYSFPSEVRLAETYSGIVAVTATLVAYSLMQMVQGYGFIAVFIAARSLRQYAYEHQYHRTLHDFTDEPEHIRLVIILLVFGGALTGELLEALSWPVVVGSLAFVLLVRPAAVSKRTNGFGKHFIGNGGKTVIAKGLEIRPEWSIVSRMNIDRFQGAEIALDTRARFVTRTA